jgi:ureidoacrylate peracid hydrolase
MEARLAVLIYEKDLTGLLLIDPYNDFTAEDGKLWDGVKAVPKQTTVSPTCSQFCRPHAPRNCGSSLPHPRYRPGDYETWRYIAPTQSGAWHRKTFENGTWRGEFRAEFLPLAGEIVALEHWCSSGFASTDLDLQLKKHGILKLIVIGLKATPVSKRRFARRLNLDTR